jgi:hypothetical protein
MKEWGGTEGKRCTLNGCVAMRRIACLVFLLSHPCYCACAGASEGDSFRLFVEDLKDDEHEVVMASAARMPAVSQMMGPARTRSEMLPFLLEYVEQDADEAHTAIARQLGDFTEVRTVESCGEEEKSGESSVQTTTLIVPLSLCCRSSWAGQRTCPFCCRCWRSSAVRRRLQFEMQ